MERQCLNHTTHINMINNKQPNYLKETISSPKKSHPLKRLLISSLALFQVVSADVIIRSDRTDFIVRRMQASRFLTQATMGVTTDSILSLAERIDQIGELAAYEEWIDNQFAMPRGVSHFDRTIAQHDRFPNIGRQVRRQSHFWDTAWWELSIREPNQLRHRMAFALSQIFVTSAEHFGNETGFERWQPHIRYYDKLMDNAFTSHRALLDDITYDPFMGVYLSTAQNGKGDPAQGIFPDENYAREVMQLFSCGVFSQNNRGEFLTNSDGELIENYDTDDIRELAQVFTGLSLIRSNGALTNFLTTTTVEEVLMRVPMVMIEGQHEQSSKVLLTGQVIPAGQSGNDDIRIALNVLARHPSTAPNLSRLLIQRLTSSNPSGAYINRVRRAWTRRGPFGTNQIGDFKAVLKAILLDPEVRNNVNYTITPINNNLSRVSVAPVDTVGGRVVEPLLKISQFYRYFEPVTRNSANNPFLRLSIENMAVGQRPLRAQTVFNFYDSDYSPASGPLGDLIAATNQDLDAPEIEILAPNVVREWESIFEVIRRRDTSSGHDWTERADLRELDRLLELDNLQTVINQLDIALCQGNMSEEIKTTILNQVNNSNRSDAIKLAELITILFTSAENSVVY